MKDYRVLFWSVTVALGGFLFGFDTAVISGAEQSIQKIWGLNTYQHGLTVSMALIGTVFGALFGSIPADNWGRKKTLFWIAVLYLISALGSALSTDWYTLLVFRFMGGLGVGASSVAAPLYISEIAPPSYRGRLVAMFQFNIVLGILLAYVSNYFLMDVGEYSWRWMLGVEAVPALVFTIAVLYIPESPRWLVVKRNKTDEARRVLKLIDENSAEDVLMAIMESRNNASQKKNSFAFFSGKYNLPIKLVILFAVFNQISGINAIIYYAPRIFEMTGLGKSSALLSSAGIGLINLVFTIIAINFIDKIGRRTLMYIGSCGLIITLGLVAKSFYAQTYNSYEVPLYLFAYIAFFALSQGAVLWVFISEIFPNKVRAKGQAMGSFIHWFLAAVIAFIFPYITDRFGGGNTFMFFSMMMVLQLLFVWKLMPETKGTLLENIEKQVV